MWPEEPIVGTYHPAVPGKPLAASPDGAVSTFIQADPKQPEATEMVIKPLSESYQSH